MFGVEEDQKERTPATRYVTFRKKERFAERKPEKTSIARVFATPEAAAKLLEFSSGAVSHSQPSLPIPEKRKPREAIKRVPRTSTGGRDYRLETTRKVRERIPNVPTQLETQVVRDSPLPADKPYSMSPDRKINTSNLRNFALERLPKGTILREIILLEEKELTTEQFLSKLPIWLRLLDHGE